MAGQIYLVTNNLNGKQYVGQTIVAKNKVGHGKLMTMAYAKHGKENFTYDVICSGLNNKSILNFTERFWIKVINSRLPNGYNIEHGGSSKDKVSDETREKLRIALTGHKKSEETKDKMRGKKVSNETKAKLAAARKTWSYSKESKAKMSASQKGRILSKETKEKICEARKKQIITEEHKQKLSIAAKKQWARQKGIM